MSVSSSTAVSSSLRPHMGHAGAARLLRVPDLPDRRELDVGEDDLRAGREPEPARERGDARPSCDVVTAISSGSALISPANAARAASVRSTQ